MVEFPETPVSVDDLQRIIALGERLGVKPGGRERAESRTRRTLILDPDEYKTLMAALSLLVSMYPNDPEGEAHKTRAHALSARLNSARAWQQWGRRV